MTSETITASDLLSTSDTTVLPAMMRYAFRAGNDAGEGFNPDDEIESWGWVYTSDEGIDLYQDGNDAVLVADVNGPWAVRVSAE